MMTRARRCTAIACRVAMLLALPGGGHVAQAQAPPAVVIEDVTVVDVAAGRLVPGRTVVIEAGRIASIQAAGTARTPPGATVLDGRGRFLVPGYADMHVHPAGPVSFDLLLAHGVTLARDMNGTPSYLAARVSLALGLMRGPWLAVASPILEGTPPPEHANVVVTAGRIILDDSAAAVDTVRSLARQGYDAIKVYNNLHAPVYAGIAAEAARQGLPVVGHVPLAVGLPGALAAGQQTIEHLRGYVLEAVPPGAPDQPAADFRSRLVAWRHADTTRLREWAVRTAAAGVWNTPTLGVLDDLLPAARIGELTSRPGWQRCMRGRFADPIATRNRSPFYAAMRDADFAATQEGAELQRSLVRMLAEEGAGLLVGTDRLPWGFSFHWELEALARAGLDPATILRAATLDAAVVLRRADELGSVEVGKRADLVLLTADPLQDVGNVRRIEAVLRNGVVHDRAALEAMIDTACQAMADAR